MAVFLDKFKITYLAVPKVACTSLKSFFFHVENGFTLGPFKINGQRYDAHEFYHKLYPTREFSKIPHDVIRDHQRFAVVRDPVDRFISCYKNRIVDSDDLSPDVMKFHNLTGECPARPSFSQFIDFLPRYRSIPNIWHHTAPQTTFLGQSLDYFTRIFSLEDIDEFVDIVDRITGSNAPLPHLKTSSRGTYPTISAEQQEVIRGYYENDYLVFGSLF